MSSELQRRKIEQVFGAMDADGDGFLTEADFQELTRRWTEARGLVPGSADHDLLRGVMMGWWTTLLEASDLDRDEKVTLNEVLLVVDALGGMSEAVVGTAYAMFEAIDADHDGRISADEYRQLIETWTGIRTDTDAIFARLDLDGDGYLSRGEFADLWTEFWAGDDREAPGTWVFGEFELPVA